MTTKYLYSIEGSNWKEHYNEVQSAYYTAGFTGVIYIKKETLSFAAFLIVTAMIRLQYGLN